MAKLYWLIITTLLISTVSAIEVNYTIIGYGFIDLNNQTEMNYTLLGLGMNAVYFSNGSCALTITYVSPMPASGSIIQNPNPITYVAHYYNTTTNNPIMCPETITAYVYGVDGSLLSSASGNATFANTTNITNNLMVYVNATVSSTGGASASTTTRQYMLLLSGITNVTNIVNNVTNILNISNITPGHVNTIEVLSVLAFIILILFLAAQFANMRILGVFASLLLLLMGVMIYTDGIVYKVGDIVGGADTAIKDSTSNTSGNTTFLNESTTTYKNTTSTNSYAYMTVPYVNFGQTVGTILILLSMFGMLHYGLGVGKYLNTGQ